VNSDILISIIVPAYNLENYLENTINSILAQTHKNIEVIIVNDGSKDGTWSVIKNLLAKDERVIGIDKENGGVTSARLEGIKAAKGEYIGFIDGDDLVDPDMFERLLANAVEYSADISHCGYKKILPDRIDYYYNTGRLVKQDKETGLKDLLEGSFVEPGLWNKLYKSTLFHSLLHDNLVDTSIKNYEDLLMNYYLFKQTKMSVYEDFCPYHYIYREGSTCHSEIGDKDVYDPITVRTLICEDIKSYGSESLLNSAVSSLIRIYISVYNLTLRDEAKAYKDFAPQIRKNIKKEKHYIKYLNKGGRIRANMIRFFPHIYKCLVNH